MREEPNQELRDAATTVLNTLLRRTCIDGVRGADVSYVRQLVAAMQYVLDHLHVIALADSGETVVVNVEGSRDGK